MVHKKIISGFSKLSKSEKIRIVSQQHENPEELVRDLKNFWASTYAEVKKDLMGRYPKHYWPDDPLTAQATRRAKPNKKYSKP